MKTEIHKQTGNVFMKTRPTTCKDCVAGQDKFQDLKWLMSSLSDALQFILQGDRKALPQLRKNDILKTILET